MIYKGYSQEQLDLQYNNRHHVPDFERHLTYWDDLSRQAEKKHPNIKEIHYGTKSLETLDVFPSDRPNSKTLIFIHGGYWRTFDKSSFYFVADAFASYGVTTVLVNYPLAPAASMDQIVTSCRKALQFIHRNLVAYNGDPVKIYVVGHSAGGHLAAMLASLNVQPLYEDLVQGVCALSGLFNLIPIHLSNLNESLRLDKDTARRNSPTQLLPLKKCAVLLAVGAEETAEFKAQSQELFTQWRRELKSIQHLVLPGLNHFSILGSLCDSTSPLHHAVCTMMKI
ncbi:MAG: alpha/beta hydrolase [Cyclobacteriaceae bacterium]|jgi:arylformamidase|nr:alpha/beta hydrolase [Cyclobacteriaceae bacterium]